MGLAAIAIAASASAATLHYDVSAETNLRYHLDCVSGVINCNRTSFAALWTALPSQDRDTVWLDRWHRLRASIRTRPFRPEPAGTSPVPFDTALAGDPAGRSANTLAEEEVLNVFRDRFETWWRDDAGAADHLRTFTTGLAHSTRTIDLDTRMAALATFYGVDWRNLGDIPIALISADRRYSGATHGEYRDRAIYVETLINESAFARTATVAHELAHFVYAASSRAQREQVRAWFVDSESAVALPAYALFNEAIATAFGNGMVERALIGEERFARMLRLPQALYADTYIDAAGRAAMPLLKQYLDDERELDREFVDAYVAALAESLGPRLTDQAFWLRVMVFASSSSTLWSLNDMVANRVRTGSLLQDDIGQGCGTRCLLKRYPELPGIVAITHEKLDALRGVVDDRDLAHIRRLSFLHGHAAYAVRRSDRSLLFIAAGSDDAGVAIALNSMLDFGQIFEGPLPQG